MNGFNLTADTQPQGPPQGTNVDITLIVAFALLLVFSAIPATATPALYVGLFLLLLTWMGAHQSGGLQAFWNEITTKGPTQ